MKKKLTLLVIVFGMFCGEASLVGGVARAEVITLRDGTVYKNVEIVRTEPDGIAVTYEPKGGGIGMATLKFRELPEKLQHQYGYDEQKAKAFEAKQEREQAALQHKMAVDYRDTAKRLADQRSKEEPILKILTQIATDYHNAHTYLGKDGYVCGDMACDVWDMIISKGIHAKIEIGNVEQDIESTREANHAWVIVDVAPGKQVAVEATGGFLVYPEQNKRYFYGHAFGDPRDFKEYVRLLKKFREARERGRQVGESYNEMVAQYNSATGPARTALKSLLEQRKAVLNQLHSDFQDCQRELDSLLANK